MVACEGVAHRQVKPRANHFTDLNETRNDLPENYVDKHSGGSLWRHPRCQEKCRKRYGNGRYRRGQIIGRKSISDRLRRVETRREIGHSELNTIIGLGQKLTIVSMIERKSRYAVLAKVPRKNAVRVSTEIITGLKPIAMIDGDDNILQWKGICRAFSHK